MAYFSKHVDKKTGAVYVYKCESYWDKELKAPRNRQVYVGKEDPKTHEIIPAAPKKAKKSRWRACLPPARSREERFFLKRLTNGLRSRNSSESALANFHRKSCRSSTFWRRKAFR